ncbi:MAG: hypothetical protein M3N54_14420 [Acidobacteriota bacterium]|nr:hypothetical protein [Acidobacteriota bacterium]
MRIGPPVTLVSQATDLIGVTSRAASELVSRLPQLGAPERSATLPSDFRLTPLMMSLLQPPLSVAGFRILDHSRSFYTKVITHSLAQNGDKQFSLLAVPTEIARDPGGDTLLALVSLEYFFDDGTYVFLLAENVDLPHKGLRDIIEKRWPKKPGRSLQVKWLPWLDLAALQSATTEADRLEALKDLVGISGGAKPPEPEKTEMAPQDKVALTRVIAGLDEFATAAGRKTALGLAGLPQYSDLPEGNARQAAGALVLRLEKEPGKPRPIRLLIEYLLASDLPAADQKTVTGLIENYPFLK